MEYAYLLIYVYLCMYVCIYMYIYMHIYICIHISIQMHHILATERSSGGSNTLIEMFDDCISILVCMILPVLEQRGIDGDLRTRRLLG
jgi:hypothetical protein